MSRVLRSLGEGTPTPGGRGEAKLQTKGRRSGVLLGGSGAWEVSLAFLLGCFFVSFFFGVSCGLEVCGVFFWCFLWYRSYVHHILRCFVQCPVSGCKRYTDLGVLRPANAQARFFFFFFFRGPRDD